MSEVDGMLKEQNHQDGVRPTTGRVVSASMLHSGTLDPKLLSGNDTEILQS
jgi:hypothetical protein